MILILFYCILSTTEVSGRQNKLPTMVVADTVLGGYNRELLRIWSDILESSNQEEYSERGYINKLIIICIKHRRTKWYAADGNSRCSIRVFSSYR